MSKQSTILFQAVGKESNGQIYDCPFLVTFPTDGSVTQQQVQEVCNQQVKQFHDYHPTGKILGQRQIHHG